MSAFVPSWRAVLVIATAMATVQLLPVRWGFAARNVFAVGPAAIVLVLTDMLTWPVGQTNSHHAALMLIWAMCVMLMAWLVATRND